jgi:hypothetical protein
MIEYAVDHCIHFAFSEEFDELHIGVAHCVHEGVPVVGSMELIDEMGVVGEKFDDFVGVALF